ncbi:MAG: 3-deoxy-manno-octulosonate cytidylyltransferase (CMP-KDO synthetase) [Halioglobus sp.]|jgi:3-deoxy-manno-octulosonate cytidylyltransferase (CMP-KDO synthetase)
MTYSVVIPARFGSTRLPGKPLLDIDGKPMIQRVWEQACRSKAERVIIATDDQRIADVARSFGGDVCMTSPDHPSGTDRLQQVVTELALDDDHIVVNVQGDEPLIPPAVIDQVAANLETHTQAGMATLCEAIEGAADLNNPNVVKVVMNAASMALYFSRAAVPWPRDAIAAGQESLPPTGDWYRHIGIYAYRTGFLHQYVNWSPAPQELLEQLEQLRALHNGVSIHVAIAAEPVPGGVDTEVDLQQVRRILQGNA